MNKQLRILVLGAITYANTTLCTPNFLHHEENAWATPVKVDHDIRVHAHEITVAPGESTDIVTIKNKGGRLWTIHGEKPGTVKLMIKRSKKGEALAHPYRVVEPKN